MGSVKARLNKLEKVAKSASDNPVFHTILFIDPQAPDRKPMRWYTLEQDGGLVREEGEPLENFKQRITGNNSSQQVYLMCCK